MVQIDILTYKYLLFYLFIVIVSFFLVVGVFWLPLVALNTFFNLLLASLFINKFVWFLSFLSILRFKSVSNLF